MEILLLYGGKSVEHEVSLKTASFIRSNLNALGHTVKDIYITKEGLFTYNDEPVSIIPQTGFFIGDNLLTADCAFIAMHGAFGEDGRVQGMLEQLDLPYISTNSSSSMLGMHKDLQYKALPTIPRIPYLCFNYQDEIDFKTVKETLGEDLILKPEAGGSSVGIIHLKEASQKEFSKSLNEIFTLDDNIIIQPYLGSFKELMLGVYKTGKEVKAIGPGMMDCALDILDYEAKYTKNNVAIFNPEPILDDVIKKEAQEMARAVFKGLNCSMYARVDLFLKGDKLYLNEINTIPGFTETSYFPQLLKRDIGVQRFLTLMIEESFKLYERRKGINHG